MLATKRNITDFIPQRHPIVMVDDLVEASETHSVTQLEIRNDNIFVDAGTLAEPGLVENIAQTAAAQVGYQCFLKQIPVPLGYIAAVKSLSITKLPAVNSRITTSIRIVNQVMDVTLAEGIVKDGEGEECCRCEMRIFVKA
ncbi:MAG TPA: 3-hydroxyacyl-ACP dehydratase [Chryseosolibacter sp.]